MSPPREVNRSSLIRPTGTQGPPALNRGLPRRPPPARARSRPRWREWQTRRPPPREPGPAPPWREWTDAPSAPGRRSSPHPIAFPAQARQLRPLAFRCRSTVRNSFHGGGPTFPPPMRAPSTTTPAAARASDSRGLGPPPSYAAGRSLSGPGPRAAAPLTPLSTARRPRRRESLVRTAPAVMPSLPAMSRQGVPAATARSSSHSARLTALWTSARRNRASMRGSAWDLPIFPKVFAAQTGAVAFHPGAGGYRPVYAFLAPPVNP